MEGLATAFRRPAEPGHQARLINPSGFTFAQCQWHG
jgi:hypothetical protein